MEDEFFKKVKEQETYGYVGDPFEQMGYDLCKRCRHKSIDRSENPDSELCKDCREELIKLKIPPVFYVIGVLVIFLMIFTMLPSVRIFGAFYSFGSKDESVRKEAKEVSDEGYVITAMDEMVSILDKSPDNVDVAIELVDMAMEYSYYDYAAYAIENYLAEEDISDEIYYRINSYINELNIYYDTIDLNNSIWEEVFVDWGQEDDLNIMLDAYCEKMSSYIGNANYDQALLYYYMANMTMDEEQGIAYLEECVDINPCYYEAQAQIAVYYRRQGDMDKARQILEDVYETNKEDYSTLRAYATLELAGGNVEDALDYARRAYDMYSEGDYVVDTYAVALAANGRMEEARELVREYEDNDYYFDDDLYDFLDGKMTLEEYYIGE